MHIKDGRWDAPTLPGRVLLSWHEKNNSCFGVFLLVCLDSTPVKWLCDWMLLLSCRNLFLSPSQCPFMQNQSFMGVGGAALRAESGHLLPAVTFEMLPDRSADACSRKRPSRDYIKQETKPRDPSKRFLWIWSNAAAGRQYRKRPHLAVLSSLTYDDVRLAWAGAGVGAEVALDLVGGLIEQIQVVFHRVSIVKALAQTDNTWCRGRRQLFPSSMLIYWN